MKANKKKIIVLCSMVVLLIVTGTLNFVLNSKLKDPAGGDVDVSAGATKTFFDERRSERASARAQEFSYLDAIISSGDPADETVVNAKAMKTEICAAMEKELALESLIKARGFDDALVTMSTNNINIIVKSDAFDAQKAGVVFSVIIKETDYAAKDIVILPYTA